MAHDVFISHSTSDKAVSDAVCAALENAGIRCWIAPRDVQPGRSFAGEITRGIQSSKAMVLIFSAHSNNSEQVLREVQLATNSHLHIIQFRIEEVLLNDDLKYFLSTPHWLDALTPPLENHLNRLETSLKVLLCTPGERSVATVASTETQTTPTEAQPFRSASLSSAKRAVSANEPEKKEDSAVGGTLSVPMNHGRKLVFAGAMVAALTALGGWWFGIEQTRKSVLPERQLTERTKSDEGDSEARRQRELAAQQIFRLESERKIAAETAEKKDSLKAIAAATKEQPYENSLGMKFVPVPGTGVLFSVWETRVKDFEVFVKATNYDATSGMYSLWEEKGWAQAGRTWKDPGFEQNGEHAVCGISWEDATAFTKWLTAEERKAGQIKAGQSYRLPTDAEWSAAVGLEKEKGSTPKSKAGKVKGVYPWGSKFPPSSQAGNYAGSEARSGDWPSHWKTIGEYRDEYARTSPAGSFAANGYGIYDLGGNVWEWCQDRYNPEMEYRVVRGASWSNNVPGDLLSSFRYNNVPETRGDAYGFRCVLAMEQHVNEEAAIEDPLGAITEASKAQPYENSLGMKFVPVSGTSVLFSIWDTRVKDYRTFAEAITDEWESPSFEQTDEHPAVNVSWERAIAFCQWLTEEELKAERITANQRYRLPTDLEWSAALGLENESGNTPEKRAMSGMKVKGRYPWGRKWPPPKGAGNYAGGEVRTGIYWDSKVIEGYRDDYPRTSPVGSFAPNQYGLYDMGGNVWQWCEDWINADKKERVARGGDWFTSHRLTLHSSMRASFTPEFTTEALGFRCVLEVDSSR